MKILQFVPETIPTHRPDLTVLFGKELPKLGIETDLVAKTKSGSEVFYSSKIFGVKSVNNRIIRDLSYFMLCLSFVFRKISEYKILQVRDMVTVGLVVLLVSKLRGKKYVYWISYLKTEDRFERALSSGCGSSKFKRFAVYVRALIEHFLLYSIILPNADFVFVQSDAMRDYVGSICPSAKGLVPVPMGVDFDEVNIRQNKKRFERLNPGPVIGYLGTLDRLRKLDILLDSLLLVKKTIPDAQLLFIGGSEVSADIDAILMKARQLQISNDVFVTGWLSSEDAWSYLKCCDVAVSPFPRGKVLDTNSPTKIIEYMALKIPCVGNDSPDQRKVLLESGCGPAVNWSSSEFADAIVNILLDPNRACARVEMGFEYIKNNRDYKKIGSDLCVKYEEILLSTSVH